MNAMPSTTRERLISEGVRQLLAKGYEGVGIGPILAAVKYRKARSTISSKARTISSSPLSRPTPRAIANFGKRLSQTFRSVP